MRDIEILDKDDPNALRYPTIKNEGEDIAQEYKLASPFRDITVPGRDNKTTPSDLGIIVPGVSDTVYFPLDFCMKDIVIDAVARKYEAGIEDYPDDEDEEHFLIGINACRESRNLNCPYMKKVLGRINKSNIESIDSDGVFAIYLLSLDNSTDNRQKFLLMTKTTLYLLHDTQAIESYAYNEIRFTPDGIELKRFGDAIGQNLLEYSFDERFLNFAHEFMLMRCTTLADVRERHPFANVVDDKKMPDIVADMGINVDETDFRPAIKKRNAYMKFLVDTATAEGYLEAKTIMRLCYMAREFRISADYMLTWLKWVIAGGIRKNKLLTEFSRTLAFIGLRYKFVFVQDLLEAGTDESGTFHRQELLKILKRPQFGLEKFVTHYLSFIVKRNEAARELQTAFQDIENRDICFKHSVRAQNYGNKLNLQMTAMGAMLNEQ